MTASSYRSSLDVAAIGNGRVAALIDKGARIVWWCFPRLDGDPIFCRLLAGDEEKGFCDVVLEGQVSATSSYIRNTCILETILISDSGAAVKVTDFAPRFWRFDRSFHPTQLMRRIEPLRGLPRISVRVRPTHSYGQVAASASHGSNHVRYMCGSNAIRVTTDIPISYVVHETPFALTHPMTLVIGSDEPIESSMDALSREFLERTRDFWVAWVRGLAVSYEWQPEIIRAAILLKLCTFEETGAITAALTTSIPEAPNTPRTWDYRFCWLRDAYFVIRALNRLGATQSMENYLDYITTIVADGKGPLKPLYGIVHNDIAAERIAPDLKGYQGMGPVRLGNLASDQLQHDAYGSVILGATQMFIDQRLPRMGDVSMFRELEALGEQARLLYLEPDAGIWEYRGRQRIHTHSATMCWVACDRLARIAKILGLGDRMAYWAEAAEKIRAEILARAWSDKRQSFTGAFDHQELDASVLLLPDLGFLPPDDPRFVKTCNTIGRELMRNGLMLRYAAEDDFGLPESAFLACQFWYIDALASIGRADEARELFGEILSHRNSFGMLSEDLHPSTGELWGNLPQTYSMAGLINSGMTLSRKWEDAWTGSAAAHHDDAEGSHKQSRSERDIVSAVTRSNGGGAFDVNG
ncbi:MULTISPECIES: glycoside hydrolase family 15 protein [unclassified Hyphomicrobium]|uniref:glycoside hydrolase family 15 protein n=1 Tax=unclassified Hyphomicrobium TaxID=2619925 RepID=UPI000213DF9A|nr:MULTISPECIES: glycoside hydrolase family 15 protein [unclassified Hyphomicrobium]CCB65842.1 Glycoside hydrolase 15-related protein [Hyphomicrobium sp. MC1]